MKLLVMTDLEGVSGVTCWDPGDKGDAETKARLAWLMTNEVNGAVEGALAAGATEVAVLEYHTIDIRQLHPGATLHLTSGPKATPRLFGLTRGRWDALAFVGNHAMAGPEGCLSHTQNLRVRCISINGRPIGEFGIQAAIAGDYGMPTILVSGDDVACAQARDLVPDIETAVVKRATSRFSAWCLAPQRARELIRDRMTAAVHRWREIKPFAIPGPVTFREELTDGMVREVTAPTVTEAFEIRCEKNS
jgi:D-amino peptidase